MEIRSITSPNLRDWRSSSLQDGKSFAETLKESVKQVDNLLKQGDAKASELVLGNDKDIASAMIAVEKASLSFQLMTQIRNKLVEAYEEIMRMQV